MSFKLFTLQAFGKLKPTEKIESERAALYADYQGFLDVEKSEELKVYKELEALVNSESFKARKKEIESLQFKGSHEHKDLLEYQKLAKSAKIKGFLQTSSSQELKKFESLKDSAVLKKYYQLKDYVEDGDFQTDKKEITSKVFKGSPEEGHLKEFNALKKNKGIKAYFKLQNSNQLEVHAKFANSEKLSSFLDLKNTADKDKEGKKQYKDLSRDPDIKKYFKFEKSTILKLYKETANSHDLKRYGELQELIDSEEFRKEKSYLQDKKKFEKSEAHKKQQEFLKLKKESDIVFYLSFEKSKAYKNYLDMKGSFELNRYVELKEKTESKEFLDRKTYLEDKKKWEKSEEYKKQQKFVEMAKQPKFINYFKYLGTDKFDFFKNWEIVFEDTFEASKLDDKKWICSSYWANKLFGENFSQPGDLQCFNSGKNISFKNKQLHLQVKNESKTGKIWNMGAGFQPAKFSYTSDTINTGESFWLDEGIVEAKIKFEPVKEMVSFVYLLGEKASPQINLLEMGAKNRIGAFRMVDGKTEFDGHQVSNLKSGKSYIFGIEKTKGKVVWKINDIVLHEISTIDFNFPVHINLATIVVNEVPSASLPAALTVDWVRCYKKK